MSPRVPADDLHYVPYDCDLPPPDAGEAPWHRDGEENDAAAGMLIWWMGGPQLTHAAGYIRLPGTPLYGKLVNLPDDLQEEMELAGSGALGRPRILGLHRARLKVLPVRHNSPLLDALHSWWGFVIQPYDRAACAEIGGRFTTLNLEPVA